MKKTNKRWAMRTLLLAALTVAALSAAAVFYAVSADSGDVSPTDTVTAEEDSAAVSDVPVDPPHLVVLAGEADIPEESRPVTEGVTKSEDGTGIHAEITHSFDDFMAPRSYTVRNQPKNYTFRPSATYQGSYESELNDIEKKIYAGYVKNFVTDGLDGAFTVTFETPVQFDAPYSIQADPANNIAEVIDDRDLALVDDYVISAAGAFFYDHPEIFWIRAFSYSMNIDIKENHKGYLNFVTISEKPSYSGAYGERAAFNAGVAEAVQTIKEMRLSDARYATLKAIHDYVCENSSYDYSAANYAGSDITPVGYAFTAAPLFTGRHKFVCEGYSKAMRILCAEFDIPCVLVSGDAGGPHMWNYVQMENGKWYGLDATWDDGSDDFYHFYFLVGAKTSIGGVAFASNHRADGQIMTTPYIYSMVYPTLNDKEYAEYVVDEVPGVTLHTLGASIRLSDPYGIRYGIQIKRDEKLNSYHHLDIPEFGTLIIASGTLGDQELTVDTPKVLRIPAKNIFSEDSTQYVYTGVLINIPESFFNTNVKGRGYFIYEGEDGLLHIVYSETVERSFTGVAQTAYDNYSSIQNPTDSQKVIIQKLKKILKIN